MKPNGQISGLIAVIFKVFKGDIVSKGDACSNLNAHVFDNFNFCSQNVPGHSVLRDSHGHHAACDVQFFKDCDPISLSHQTVGCCQAGWSSTDNGHLFLPFLLHFRDMLDLAGKIQICKESVQILDGNRLVHVTAGTHGFAGMVTNAAADGWEGMGLFKKFKRLPKFTLINQGHISLNTHMSRAGGLTWGRSFLVDNIVNRYGLWEGSVDGLSHTKPLVPFARPFDGADIGAVTASRADPFFDVTGFTKDFYLIVANEARHLSHFTVREKLNIRTLPYGDHLRGSDTSRTIQGGEGLVKLEHMATNRGLPFYQIDLVACFGDIKCCLHPRDTTTHNKDIRMNIYPT